MNKHLALTCFAYAALGIGGTIENLGVKAGMNPFIVLVIFISCLAFFVIIVFTSMEKLKRTLSNADKEDLKKEEKVKL